MTHDSLILYTFFKNETQDLNIKFYCSTSHNFLLYRLDLSSIVPLTLMLCHNNELQTRTFMSKKATCIWQNISYCLNSMHAEVFRLLSFLTRQ